MECHQSSEGCGFDSRLGLKNIHQQNNLPRKQKLIPCGFSIAEPSGPPTGISLVHSNQTDIAITWSAPVTSQLNGILIRYSLCIRAESEVACQRQNSVAATQTSYVFGGLAPYINYTILVSAATVVGYGPEAVFTQRTSPSGMDMFVCFVFMETMMHMDITWTRISTPRGHELALRGLWAQR